MTTPPDDGPLVGLLTKHCQQIPLKNDDTQRGAGIFVRPMLQKIEGWQCRLRRGEIKEVLESMGEEGCAIDDFLQGRHLEQYYPEIA